MEFPVQDLYRGERAISVIAPNKVSGQLVEASLQNDYTAKYNLIKIFGLPCSFSSSLSRCEIYKVLRTASSYSLWRTTVVTINTNSTYEIIRGSKIPIPNADRGFTAVLL